MSGDCWGQKIDGSGPAVIPISADGRSIPTSGGGGSFTLSSYSHAITTALANSLVVKAAAGTVGLVSGRLDSTAASGTYYIQLWNLAALPADTTAVSNVNSLAAPLKIQHTIGVDDYFSFATPAGGVVASAGISLGLSTTEFTKTAAGAFMSASASFL